eukprot:7210590-Alexandrium_andersonii.AAC.1
MAKLVLVLQHFWAQVSSTPGQPQGYSSPAHSIDAAASALIAHVPLGTHELKAHAFKWHGDLPNRAASLS